MKLSVSEMRKYLSDKLSSFGFPEKQISLIAENFLEAEISGKTSHGLSKLIWFKSAIDKGQMPIVKDEPTVMKETPVSLLINGNQATGFYVMNYALELALEKVKKSGMVGVGLTNTSPTTGYVGAYARKSAEEKMIFLGFNNSPGRVAPHASKKKMLGSNPTTVGIPAGDKSVILDMATSKITVGDLTKSMAVDKPLSKGIAINANGQPETDPQVVWDEGALLPIAGHKGSGLALVGEFLAGALTGSRVVFSVEGGWGTFFILIDPTMFREIEEFEKDVKAGIRELKDLPRVNKNTEIYYPGEQSQIARDQTLKNDYVEIDNNLWNKLEAL